MIVMMPILMCFRPSSGNHREHNNGNKRNSRNRNTRNHK